MARESVQDKSRRLLVEGRLVVLRAGDEYDGLIHAECRGDSGAIYDLGFDPKLRQWRCTCPEQKGRCSHIAALQLVTVAAVVSGESPSQSTASADRKPPPAEQEATVGGGTTHQ